MLVNKYLLTQVACQYFKLCKQLSYKFLSGALNNFLKNKGNFY